MQAASASVATWLALRWIDSSEAFVGIISAVLVVQATVDDTVARVRDRLAATAFGSVVGVGCLLALPGAAATPLALALSMAVINAVATIRSGWRYGAVAAIALSLSSEQTVIAAALDRLLAIGIGAAIGLSVSLVLWPDSARNRAGRHLRGALSSLGDQLARSMETVGESSAADIDPSAYHADVDKARAAASDVVGDDDVVSRQLTATDRLYNSVLIVRRVVDTSGALTGIEELDDAVDALRQHAHDVVEHLAEGGGERLDAAEVLDDIERRVDRAREALDAADDDRDRRTHRHTLLFALRQIEQGLGELLDSFTERDVSDARP
jgi:uncharacterized membrane protein YccC